MIDNAHPPQAAVAAHLRVFDGMGRPLGGINAEMVIKVIDIHEAETIALELGLYLTCSTTLHDLLETWGFPNGGRRAMRRIECFYDRQGIISDGHWAILHDQVIAHFWVQIQHEYPYLEFLQGTWVPREDPWFRPVNDAARTARRHRRMARPIWLLAMDHRATGRPGLAPFSYPLDRTYRHHNWRHALP